MDFLIALIVTIAVLQVQGKTIGPVRPILNNSSPPLTPPGQQYKDVILYLTPSQIRALEQGQGYVNIPQTSQAPQAPQVPQAPQAPQTPQVDSEKHTQAYIHPNPQIQQNRPLNPQLARPHPLRTPPFQEAQDPFIPIVPPPHYRQLENPAYNTFQPPNHKRILKPIPFFPDPNKEESNNDPKAQLTSAPQDPPPGKGDEDQILRQQLKEQWIDLLNQNIAHFKALQALSQNPKEKSTENKNFPYTAQNDFRYNDQKYASEVYKLVRSSNEHQSELQQALLQAGAIANSPPVLVHKEINIKHTPGHVITHVPVPTPVFIPVPGIKVPRVYSVPLEFLRTLPVPITKTQTNEDRSVPSELRQQIPLSAAKNEYVDRPEFEGNGLPSGNPSHNQGNPVIHSHEWHH